MIKVMVVIYGLVMFVPTGDGSQDCDHVSQFGCTAAKLTAVFVDGGDHVDGEHEPIIRWVQSEGELGEDWRPPADFDIAVESPLAGPIELQALTTFPHLGAFSSRRVPASCLDPGGVCKANNKDLTFGVATFSGSWTAAGATYCCGFKLPIGDYDRARIKFPRTDRTQPDTFGERPIATALALTTTLDDAQWQDLKVTLGQTDKKQVPLTGGACERWLGAGVDKCAVLVMGNPPTEYAPCSGTACRYDHHFSAFYLLTQDRGDMNAWRIPYVTGSAKCPEPHPAARDQECWSANVAWSEDRLEPQNMPSVRCPPTFAQVGPEAVTEPE